MGSQKDPVRMSFKPCWFTTFLSSTIVADMAVPLGSSQVFDPAAPTGTQRQPTRVVGTHQVTKRSSQTASRCRLIRLLTEATAYFPPSSDNDNVIMCSLEYCSCFLFGMLRSSPKLPQTMQQWETCLCPVSEVHVQHVGTVAEPPQTEHGSFHGASQGSH